MAYLLQLLQKELYTTDARLNILRPKGIYISSHYSSEVSQHLRHEAK